MMLAGMLENWGASDGGPAATQVLGANEVLLELSARGVVRTRADTATFRVNLSGHGSNPTEARTAHDARLRQITDAVRAAGMAQSDIETSQEGVAGLPVFDVEEPPPPEGEMPVPQSFVASMTTIVVRDVSKVEAVLAALRQIGAPVNSPRYSLNDDAAPRRAARANALAAARSDAEAYASSLSMRVVRLVRVTERGGFDLMSGMFGEMFGQGRGPSEIFGQPENGQVPTVVLLGVDFVLAPR